MGASSSTPSYAYDQIYLPADCFRVCNPHSCFCSGSSSGNGGGHHSRSKYVYVERNNPSGRESYRDPMELVERGLVPPGWGMGSVNLWRPKDYEVMSRVLAQYMANQRGITEVPWGEMGMGGGLQGYGMGAYSGHPYQHPARPPPPPWSHWQGQWQGGPDAGNGRREIVVDEETRTKIQLLNDIMFGSEADKQEKQVQEQLLKRLTPMIPDLAKLIALQQAGLNGATANGGMMPGPPPPGSMPQGAMGMGGMHPYGSPGGMSGMNPMMYPPVGMGGMHQMMGGGDPGMMMSGAGGDMGRRRNRGRRGMRDFDYDEDDDDDFGGFGRGRAGGRRRRRGRYNFDDDDLFGDRGGEGEYVESALVVQIGTVADYLTDSRGRGPPRGPQRPRPSNSGGGGAGGGSTSGGGEVFDTFNDDARFRTVPAGDPQPAQWTSSRHAAQTPMATAPPDRVLTPVEEPINMSPPPMPVNRPPPPGAIPISPERAPPYRSFDSTWLPTYPDIPVGDHLPSARPIPMRHAHFRPEAGLARPRQDEENRGEPQAGGPVGAHDVTPL
jgi:hypothetical protein